ncbi:MAG: sigma-54-dependent Fis family transcriptional regulator [Gammaproteobacteria bacterium]|nr:sigma-54-dependent Fis family transcriptional regulator [Gammaproteobacteria bacterium]
MDTKRILVVDDEDKMRRLLELSLKGMGHDVVQAEDGIAALEAFDAAPFDLVLTDLRMPRLDGMGLLRALRERGEDVPVIVLTAYATVETAIEAMKLGATDYIVRPLEIKDMELAVARALAVGTVQRENRFLRSEVDKGWGEFIGDSPKMQALYRLVRQVAPARSNVFIVGETGTGKELVARAVHQESARSGLFVPINCAAIPAELLESELFGHQKGAFTGAVRDRIGKCELADRGTLFLDEITEMPLALQAKLLRVIQEGEVERLGAQHPKKVDLRIVAATNRDPQRAVEDGLLRTDLYFRLNVVRIDVPLLRERTQDIPQLAQHFLEKYANELGRKVPRLNQDALEYLLNYPWPGNVRELQNLMERACVLCTGDTVTREHLPADITQRTAPTTAASTTTLIGESTSLALNPLVEELEKTVIRHALERSGNNKAAAARLLEISERALWYKIKRYGL